LTLKIFKVLVLVFIAVGAYQLVNEHARVGWSLVLMACGIAITGHALWYERRGPGAVINGLRLHWLELPGASLHEDGLVQVFDGAQKLFIRLEHRDGQIAGAVQLRIGDTPIALRIWPRDQAVPSMDERGLPVAGPRMERAALVEARFAGRLQAESNDENRALRLVSGETGELLARIHHALGTGFCGITYDGRTLAVHLAGPLIADPLRTLSSVRALWTSFGAYEPGDNGPTGLAL